MHHGAERPFMESAPSASVESRCARPQRATFVKIHYDRTVRSADNSEEFLMHLVAAKPGDTIKCTSMFAVKEPIVCRVPDLRIVGPLRISPTTGEAAAVTVNERTIFDCVVVESLDNVGVRIVNGDSSFTNCTLSGEQGGVVLTVRANIVFTKCRLDDSRSGFGVDLQARGTCEIDECSVKGNGRGGVNLLEGASLWINKSTVAQNRQFGIAMNKGSSGHVLHSDIFANATQGIFVAPESSAIVWRCTIHDNSASGVKIWGNCTVEETTFQSNADRDLDIVSGDAHVARSRFRGGRSQAVVVTGKDAQATLKYNCFDQYAVWAMSAHEGARVRLERNFFNTSIDFEQTRPLDDEAGGSGLLLQYNVRGSAKENAFVGWRRGYVRSRVAFHINRCPVFKQLGANDGIVELETLRQESAVVFDELMEVSAQNPDHVDIDLSFARLQRKRRSSASSSSSEDPNRKRTMDAETIENILPILQCDAVAHRIDVSGNRHIGDEGVRHLATAIAHHPELNTVNFSRIGMTDASVKQFCQAAACAPKLQSIDLAENDISPASIPVVTQMLRDNRNIHRFNVSGNKRLEREAQDDIDFLCAANEFASMKARDQLISLRDGKQDLICADLSGQVIQGASEHDRFAWPDASRMMNVMCYSMRLNKWVTTLHIDTNQIDDAGLASLARFLRDKAAAPKLETLSISGNGITDISPLTKAIAESGRIIRALDLSDNHLTGRKNADALRSLLGSTTLNHLNIATNFFTKNDIDCLVFSLPEGVRVRSEGQQPLPNPQSATPMMAPPSASASAWEAGEEDEKRPGTTAAPKRRMRVPQVFPLRSTTAMDE